MESTRKYLNGTCAGAMLDVSESELTIITKIMQETARCSEMSPEVRQAAARYAEDCKALYSCRPSGEAYDCQWG